MNTKKRFIISFIVVFLAAAASVSGQSMFNSEYYKKAVDLQKQAEAAFDNGEYDLSVEYSREADNFRSLSELYGNLVYNMYKANGAIVLAKDRITYARGIHADENFSSEFSQAITSYGDAKRLYDEGVVSYRIVTGYLRKPEPDMDRAPFDAGIEAFIRSGLSGKTVLALLKDIRLIVKEPEPAPVVIVKAEPEPEPVVVVEPEPEPVVEVVVEPAPEPEPAPVIVMAAPAAPPEILLPRYYTVRLIPSRRDCFWRIAEYSFIFGDPLKWKLIYELNKSKLPDPKNPDLILPGIVLEIPSLKGEKRDGMFDPSVNYPKLK